MEVHGASSQPRVDIHGNEIPDDDWIDPALLELQEMENANRYAD